MSSYAKIKKQGMPDPRKKLYTLLRVGKEQLNWDEEFYRHVLCRFGALTNARGKISAATMSIQQLQQMLDHMKSCGFVVVKKTKSTPVDKALSKWAELAEYGIVRDGSLKALNSFVKKQTELDSVFFLKDAPHVRRVLTALDNMGKKHTTK